MDWFEFEVEGSAGLHVRVEASGGALRFILNNDGDQAADLRGFFFDVRDPTVISSLTATGADITAQAKGDEGVVNLGGGVTMAGAGAFDFGVAFGTAGIGKDDIRHTEFTLSSVGHQLTLADVLGQDFGVRFTSVGVEGGPRNGSLKLVASGTGEVHHDGGTPGDGGGGPGPIDLPPVV